MQLGQIPSLRHKAKEDGNKAARLSARAEAKEAIAAGQEAKRRAEVAERTHRAAVRDLLALRDQVQAHLRAPGPPTYEEMRRDILASQPQLLGRFLRATKFKDGSTLEDKFEDFQRRAFSHHQRRETDPLGRYTGASYEQWKDRSLQMQRKIDTAKLSNRVAVMNSQEGGFENGSHISGTPQ